MKRWQIVYGLPLEVWVDIFSFPWISRQEFGQLVERIGNFKFAEHAHFYLHEWGKRTLGRVFFFKDYICKYTNYGAPDCVQHLLDVPQTPLPNNIKYFDYILIRHIDANAMDFLDKIRPLLTDLELYLSIRQFHPIFTDLASLLHDGTRNLWCIPLTVVPRYFSREKLTKLKVLQYYDNDLIMDAAMVREHVDIIMNWLIQEGHYGPRLFQAYLSYDERNHAFFGQIFKAIRQEFLTAKTPCTFAVDLKRPIRWTEFHLENSIGEELHGVWIGPMLCWSRKFHITRHRANCGMELQEWIKENHRRKEHGFIHVDITTIGSFDAAQLDAPPVEETVQQPSCSSKEP